MKIRFPKFTEKMKRRFMAGACAVLMVFISVVAYLTSTEKVTNRFTVGNIKIDLIEPNFPGNADPDTVLTNKRIIGEDTDKIDVSYADANYILPGEIVPKDPTIVNTGKNEAIVFMKVVVPTYIDVTGVEREVFVFTSDSDINNGQYKDNITTKKFSELTAGDTLGTALGTNDADAENWIFLGKAEDNNLDSVNGTVQNNSHTYIFGYKKVLNPEADTDLTKDGAGIKQDTNHTNSATPYKTAPLFKYVMLNPELNGVDTYEGNKFYQITQDSGTDPDPNNTSYKAITQDIRIFSYGVQAKYLSSEIDLAVNSNELSKDNLTAVWNTAEFGKLLNEKIPEADNHNKYDIPNDPTDKNYPKDGNGWTDGNGEPIQLNNKSVLTKKVTYTTSDPNSRTYTYYKVEGDNAWKGAWYPYGSHTGTSGSEDISNTEWTYNGDTVRFNNNQDLAMFLDRIIDNEINLTTSLYDGTALLDDNGTTSDENFVLSYKTFVFTGAGELKFAKLGSEDWQCLTTDSAGNVVTTIPEGTWVNVTDNNDTLDSSSPNVVSSIIQGLTSNSNWTSVDTVKFTKETTP